MEIDGPAIRALGSLFKLTEVHIWDDGATDMREISLFPDSPQDLDECSNIPAAASVDISPTPEDVDLAEKMDALGLPLAFLSNKETRNKKSKSKRIGTRLKRSLGHKEAKDVALEVTCVSGVEIASPDVLHDNTRNSLCCMSMLGQSESCSYDIAVGISESEFHASEDSESSTKVVYRPAMEQIVEEICDDLPDNGQECEYLPHSDISKDDNKKGWSFSNPGAAPSPACCLADIAIDNVEKGHGKNLMVDVCLEDSSVDDHLAKGGDFCNYNSHGQGETSGTVVFSRNSEILGHDSMDSHNCSDNFGDWMVYWDSLCMRNYFHNVKTDTSTWHPPPGMEHLGFGGVTIDSNEVMDKDGNPSSFCDSKLDLPSDGASLGIGIAADSSLPDLTMPTGNGIFEHPDGLHGMNESFDCESKLCLPSDAKEHVESLTSTITEITGRSSMCIEIAGPERDKLDMQLDPAVKKQKKKARKKRAHRKPSNDSEELQSPETKEEFPATIGKYWLQRYLLFSRYDDGIKMDEEGWFSVTPEPISRHHAFRCVGDAIIDGFTGVGGNAIQFAQRCKEVTAIDIDPKKIDYAYHNATIYGVNNQINFIKGDFFVLAPRLKADIVFLSPPWGGPDYAKVRTYDMTMLKPHNGYFLFNTAKQIACRIVMFLPKNIDINQLAELSLSANPPWSLEVEKNFLNGNFKAITAYFKDTSS